MSEEEGLTGSESSTSAAEIERKLFVYNLSKEVTDKDLQPLFAPFNPIYATVALGKKGTSRRFGFALFPTPTHAERACKALQGTELHGKEIEIKLALAPEPTADKLAAAIQAKQRLLAKAKSADSWTISTQLADLPALPAAPVQQQPGQDVPRHHKPAQAVQPRTMVPEYSHQPGPSLLPAQAAHPSMLGPLPSGLPWHVVDGAAAPLPANPTWNPMGPPPGMAQMHPQLMPVYDGARPMYPAFALPQSQQPPPPPAPPAQGLGGRRVLLVQHGPGANLPKVAEPFYALNCTNAQLNATGQSAFEFRCAGDAEAALQALNGIEVAGRELRITMAPPAWGPPAHAYDLSTAPRVPWHMQHAAAAPPRPTPPPPGMPCAPMAYNGPPVQPPLAPGFHPGMHPFHQPGIVPPPRPIAPVPGSTPMPANTAAHHTAQPTPAHHIPAAHNLHAATPAQSGLRASAPEFQPSGPPKKAMPLFNALAWINSAVIMTAVEGRAYLPALSPKASCVKPPATCSPGTPRSQGTDWTKRYAALNPFNLELVFVGRHLMRSLQAVEMGLIRAAPANVRPVSVLIGALVRVLIDKAYSLRIIMDTHLDGERLMLVLNDVTHPVQADHISNHNPLDPGMAGEVTSEQGRQELLELHARLSFKGLRMTRFGVAQVSWRLSAAAQFSSQPDQQQAEEELRLEFENMEGIRKLEQQVQPINLIEEAQILHAAFAMPGWKDSAAWLPSAVALLAEASPAPKPPAAAGPNSTATPGTQDMCTRQGPLWLRDLLSFQPAAAAGPNSTTTAGTQERCTRQGLHWLKGLLNFKPGAAGSCQHDAIEAAATNLMAIFPPMSPDWAASELSYGLLSDVAESDDAVDPEREQLLAIA